MSHICDSAELLAYFPPELLRIIFLYLPAKTMTHCREVCRLWKDVIDDMSKNDNMWRRNCKMDFSNIYEAARRKAKRGVRWFTLYRSLSVWRLLMNAAETRDTFVATVTSPLTEIRNFKILNDGIVGVLQDGCIAYYDIETLSLADLPPLLGNYSRYTDNDHFLVVLSSSLHLHIMRKVQKHTLHKVPALAYDNVKQFALIGQELYFVSYQDDIFVCDLRSNNLNANFMARSFDRILSIAPSEGYGNVLTFQRHILAFVKNNVIVKGTLGVYSNLIQQLEKLQLLTDMDWRVYFQGKYEMDHEVPDTPMRDINIIKKYGNIYFVGSYWGILRIYYSANPTGKFDILTATPLKQFNLMQAEDRGLRICPILQIDVMEGKDGHTVIVAMPKRIVVLYFKHYFKTRTFGNHAPAMRPALPEIPDEDVCVPGTSRQN